MTGTFLLAVDKEVHVLLIFSSDVGAVSLLNTTGSLFIFGHEFNITSILTANAKGIKNFGWGLMLFW